MKLADVARQAGVSTSIASRILNDSDDVRVRPDTRERILQVAQELGYRPNPTARSLRAARSGVIVVLLPAVTDPLFAEVFEGVHEEASRIGVRALYDSIETYEDDPNLFCELMDRGHVDGFVIQLADEARIDEFKRLIPNGTPCVFLQSSAAGVKAVLLDDEAAGYLATAHLIKLGHRRIGFIGNVAGNQFGDRRFRGFKKALREHSIPVRARWVRRTGNLIEDGSGAFDDMARFNAHDLPTSVVVASVIPAFGVLYKAWDLGITVPSDISVVAIHDSALAGYSIPPLTTVKLPLRELGATALRTVQDIVEGKVASTHTVTDPAPLVIDRQSAARV